MNQSLSMMDYEMPYMPVGKGAGYTTNPYSAIRAGGSFGMFTEPVKKLTPEEEFQSELTPRWSDPWMGTPSAMRKKAFEEQKQQEEFADLKMEAESQRLKSQMQFQPLQDQLRMSMMRNIGSQFGVNIPTTQQAPYASGAPTYLWNSMQSAMERSGGTRTTPILTPSSWMQNYQSPQFPSY